MLSGPTDIPANPTHALVCLHGFAADGYDFINFAQPLRSTLPPTVTLTVFSPHAPERTPFDDGYQWFSDKAWTFRDKPGITRAANAVWEYINSEIIAKHHIPAANIAVFGFSQGAMTALYAAPRWPQTVGAVIAHSGVAMWQEELDATTCQKPPVLFLHGQEDDVIPADQSLNAATGLNHLGFSTEVHILPNLAHGADARSLAHISAFLQTIWGKQQQ